MSAQLSPIGVFDSGIGGLTVASAIHKAMPGRQLIYFGDTAHLPYGDKSAKAIKHFSLRITRFLIERGCETIVVACNTASSIARNEIAAAAGPRVKVHNVIDPVAKFVAANYSNCNIGVIGTRGTIRTRAYPRVIERLNPGLRVKSLATPLLVPMIEEGFFNNNISESIINNYLSSHHLKDISALILGCTHYPLIRKQVEAFYRDSKVNVLDAASIVANDLAASEPPFSGKAAAPHHFYVSDYTGSFENSTRVFFGEKIHLEVFDLWASL
jgi:glutamate racemase